jgi:hypothetical protein
MATTDSKIEDFAEELGRLLGTAEAKARGWLGQREQIAKTLEGIRDTASRLLNDLGHQAARAVRRGRPAPLAGPFSFRLRAGCSGCGGRSSDLFVDRSRFRVLMQDISLDRNTAYARPETIGALPRPGVPRVLVCHEPDRRIRSSVPNCAHRHQHPTLVNKTRTSVYPMPPKRTAFLPSKGRNAKAHLHAERPLVRRFFAEIIDE